MNSNATSRLVSIGSYLPEVRVKTKDFLDEIGYEKFGVGLNHIENNLGITEVRHSNQEKLPSQLAIPAARSALEKIQSEINLDHIDLIIYCGIEGDYVEPSTAHVVQAALGLKSSICFDVQNACLGFMSGLQIADSMIKSGAVRYALVCTGEQFSKVTKASIRELKKSSSKKLFDLRVGGLTVGDAGGAAIIGPRKDKYGGFLKFGTESKGQYTNLCYYRHKNDGFIEAQLNMGKICAVIINTHKRIYKDTLEASGWQPDDIDCLVTHQVGAKVFSLLSGAFDIPEKKMTRTYNNLGNLATAGFAVNMTKAMDEGMVKNRSNIWAAMAGSGISVCHVGFTLD